jgi:hypothetical protein
MESNKMKLTPVGLFHTPATSTELLDYINGLPAGDRTLAMTVMGMTWNLCAKIVNKPVDK